MATRSVTKKHGNPGLENPLPLSTCCLSQDIGGALKVGKKIPSQSVESHSFVEGTKVILKRFDRAAVQRLGRQDF